LVLELKLVGDGKAGGVDGGGKHLVDVSVDKDVFVGLAFHFDELFVSDYEGVGEFGDLFGWFVV
jgi:hypothetical protein